MKRTDVVAFLAGVVFAVGLGISGMMLPSKVIGFLDITGAWDPSLGLVMAGAIATHFAFARRASSATSPRFAPTFSVPREAPIDRRLVLGAALFGIGWGIAGFCPAPAVVSIVTLTPSTLAFVAAMLASMGTYALLFEPSVQLWRKSSSPANDVRTLGGPAE